MHDVLFVNEVFLKHGIIDQSSVLIVFMSSLDSDCGVLYALWLLLVLDVLTEVHNLCDDCMSDIKDV